MLGHLRAGIFTPATTCLHCSRPLVGAGRCACGGDHGPRRPHHGLAEVFLGMTREKRRGFA